MDSVEKAIRAAFDKGDPTDRAFRESVYRQVLGALDRAIAANASLPEEAAAKRREGLKATIVRIEREFLPAREASSTRPDQSSPVVDEERAAAVPSAEPGEGGDQRRIEEAPHEPPLVANRAASRGEAPSLGSASREEEAFSALRDDPSFKGGAFSEDGSDAIMPADRDLRAEDGPYSERRGAADSRRRPPRRRRIYAISFFAVTLIAAVGIGLWWASSTGLFKSAEERDTSVPSPPRNLEPEDFTPDASGQADQAPLPLAEEAAVVDREWIPVFAPTEPGEVTAPGDAVAEIAQDDGVAYLRLRTGPSGAPVRFDVGRGVLERLAGRKAVFSVSARAESGVITQMAVGCSLGGLADCGRKRYVVNQERADYLFEIDVPEGQPESAGAITIVSDVEAGRQQVEVFEIKVAIQ